MGYSVAGRNIGLDAIGDAGTSIRTHTGDPGASGTGNPGTGSAQTPSWAAASGGEKALASDLQFTGLASGEDVTYYSVWADSNTTFLGSGQITTGDVQANAAGEYTLTTATKLVIT